MAVSVETLSNLERKVTVTISSDIIDNEVNSELKKYASKAKIDGFRPGKAPVSVVRKRYLDSVMAEVAQKRVNASLPEVLKEENLNPIGYPDIEVEILEAGKDMVYSAKFEVFPEFDVQELNKAKVEQVKATVADSDVDATIEKLREQHKDWKAVKRKSKSGDKVTIDFDGFLEGEAFDGGKAEGHELELGSGSFIPGFEDGIIGKKAGEEFELEVTFPAEYQAEHLAGKLVTFKVVLHKVEDAKLPELDDKFAEKFNVTKGGYEAFLKEIKENMERELERRVSSMNREKAFEQLIKANTFDVPKALLEMEKDNLAHEYYHMIYGAEHKENETIPDFLRDMVTDKADHRVRLGLVFSEYVKKHELKTDDAYVDAELNKFVQAYEDPEQMLQNIKNDEKQFADFQAMILEEVVAKKILEDAKIVKSSMDFDSVMNPKQPEPEVTEEASAEE